MTAPIINDIPPYSQAVAIQGQTVYGQATWTANTASDVIVYVTPFGDSPNDAAQILSYPSQYSVAFIGSTQAVQITLVTPSNAGDIVTWTRMTPADRLNQYSNTNFTPSMLNNDFGILTLVDQQAQLVNQLIGPRYNYSAIIVDVVDTILPILGANQTWVKNSGNTAIITYTLPASGIAPAAATYVTIADETATLPNSVNFVGVPTGMVAYNASSPGSFLTRILTGTALEIAIANGNGIAGNPTVSIVDNPLIPGTAGMGIPAGTTAQRVIPTPPSIGLRFNTDLELIEYYDAGISTWAGLSSDVALLALFASHAAGEGASLIGLEGTGTVQDLAEAPFILQAANAATPNGLVLTAGSNITLTLGVGTLTVAASPGGGVNPGLINEIAYYPAAGNTLDGLPTAVNGVLVTDGTGVPSISSTLPQAVQDNITYLGAQAEALNMNSHLINNVTDPVSAQDAATKNYVDQTALNGTSVYATSAATLGTVTQSGAGVGATLTNAGAQATFALDGVNPPVGSNVLIKNTATGMTAANEGIYTVTSVGSGATNWVLTRASSYDTTTEINNTGLIVIQNGSTLAGTAWYNASTIVTVDTTAFSYSEFGNIVFPITLAHGGTNANLTASNGGIFYSTASAGAILSGTATAGLLLQSGASGAPSWLATANSGVLVTSGSGVPSISTTIPKGVATVGVTDASSAASGVIGEVISSTVLSGSGVSLTTATAADITSISLTTGDWDVWGNVTFSPSGGTGVLASVTSWGSTTSASLPDAALRNLINFGSGISSGAGINIPTIRVNVSSPTTVYLSGSCSFSSTTCTASGSIFARRRR